MQCYMFLSKVILFQFLVLMVKSWIANLIFEPYFGNNSQFIFSNGEWEFTFDIYVLIVF